jgi:ArsR family transcriptional regulator, arsenate/arsenite/antimonite-responsive transcriptional repressor
MDIDFAIKSFTALSQETRLQALLVLVKHGKQGLAAGDLAEKISVPQNTLSFHLSNLRNAGLVKSRKEKNSIIYYADISAIQGLAQFLLADCCAIDKSTCKGIEKILQKACC